MKDHQRTGRTLVAGAVIGLMAFSNGNAGTEREAGIVIDGDRVTVFDQGKRSKLSAAMMASKSTRAASSLPRTPVKNIRLASKLTWR